MALYDELGLAPPEDPEDEIPYKKTSISPFDFVNSVTHNKQNLMVDEWSEKQYKPFIVNRSLSYGADTVIYANEMNSRPHIPAPFQYSFLLNTIRPRKRFNKWIRAEKIEAIDVIKEYYGFGTKKAQVALSILTDKQIGYITLKLNKGGI